MDLIKKLVEAAEIGGQWGWIVSVFGVVLATGIAAWIKRTVYRRLRKGLAQTKNPWDDALLHASSRPLTITIWVTGLVFAAYVATARTGSPLFEAFRPLLTIGILVNAVWFVIRFIRETENILIERRNEDGEPSWDKTTVDAMGKLLRLSIIVTGTLVILDSIGMDISGVLAFGGVSGIAIGYAAKDLLANFFGALMLYLDRPMAVGDWVRSPDRNIEGTVEEIGWRLTRIRTFDKRPLYVPNSVFTNISVENPSRMTHRRLQETFGLRYDDVGKVQAITDDVRAMLTAHEAIATDQTLMVWFDEFNASSVDFFIYCFTHTTVWSDFHGIKHELLLEIAAIVERHGAEFAFPTSTVHLPDGVQLAGLPGVTGKA